MLPVTYRVETRSPWGSTWADCGVSYASPYGAHQACKSFRAVGQLARIVDEPAEPGRYVVDNRGMLADPGFWAKDTVAIVAVSLGLCPGDGPLVTFRI